jgi:tetratricopeptide (TPR) repeat protein
MSYYQRIGDRVRLENMRAELAGFYLNVGDFEKVIAPSEQALRFFEQIKHENRIMYLCSNLAEAYFETGNLEKAEQYALRARSFENPRIQPYVYYTLGLINQAKMESDIAQHSFETGIAMANNIGDRFIAAYLYRAYGSFLVAIDRVDDGWTHLTDAFQIFSDLGIAHEIEKTRTLLN